MKAGTPVGGEAAGTHEMRGGKPPPLRGVGLARAPGNQFGNRFWILGLTSGEAGMPRDAG